ncbi:hypothetical protein K2173_010349 [Erythroxylum novogranatense]|uniref:Protein kinase domain-containing protein n=1 Tax=Erythroxylum novogranatense TaxID=1862640 RepID=A0AAV8TFD2_9ROSI|nr:hypothetical protein K2173_010349 [Erythroxylum novogranatense]
MLSRAFTKPKRNPRYEDCSNWSGTILEYDEESLVGFVDNLPLTFCGENESQLSLREVLRASVGVMGESRLGMTEKVVLLEGKVYAAKRFRIVSVGRREFNRRVERFAEVSQKCRNLVPPTAFIYAKRIKFVLCDYYPMGSLADLLTGGRENGHTALDWNQRYMIALFTARAIAFVHAQYPPYEKRMQMNVHGNVKASNIMVNVDFTACLSDYGFIQLADLEEAPDTWQKKRPHPPDCSYSNKISQACDMYNFGVVLLDMLGGPGFTGCITQKKEKIKEALSWILPYSVKMHHCPYPSKAIPPSG